MNPDDESNRPEVFCEKAILIFLLVHRKTPFTESFFTKVADLHSVKYLQMANSEMTTSRDIIGVFQTLLQTYDGAFLQNQLVTKSW